MKGLVCGGRQFNDAEMLASRLIEIYRDRGITEIIEGGAAGADTLARKFGEHKGIPVRTFPADWDRHGRAAGVKVLEREGLGSGDRGSRAVRRAFIGSGLAESACARPEVCGNIRLAEDEGEPNLSTATLEKAECAL